MKHLDEKKLFLDVGTEKVSDGPNHLIWLKLCVVLTVGVFGGSLFTLALVKWNPSMLSQFDKRPSMKVTDRFPGYFRSLSEQAELERRLQNLDKSWITTGNDVHQFPLTNLWNNTTSHHFHGCCRTLQMFETYDCKKDISGHLRKLARFEDNWQFFPTEICSMENPCSRSCHCTQKYFYATAVYEKGVGCYDNDDSDDDKEYAIGFFQFPGCWKCLNV